MLAHRTEHHSLCLKCILLYLSNDDDAVFCSSPTPPPPPPSSSSSSSSSPSSLSFPVGLFGPVADITNRISSKVFQNFVLLLDNILRSLFWNPVRTHPVNTLFPVSFALFH
jgi:hypothetical protein